MGILGISAFLEMVVSENRLAHLFHMVPRSQELPTPQLALPVCLRGQINFFFSVLQSGAWECHRLRNVRLSSPAVTENSFSLEGAGLLALCGPWGRSRAESASLSSRPSVLVSASAVTHSTGSCLASLLGRFDRSVRSVPGAAVPRARPEEAWWEFRKVALAALLGSTAGQPLVFCKAGMSLVGG